MVSVLVCHRLLTLTRRMDSLQKLIGQIPSNPLWAEVLASQRRNSSPESAPSPRGAPMPNKSRRSSVAKERERRASGGTVKARKPSLAREQHHQHRSRSQLSQSTTASTTASSLPQAPQIGQQGQQGQQGVRKPSQGGAAAAGRRMHREV